MLDIQDVSFAYKDNILFKNLSFHVDSGEIVSILGPSGSGKTTLFRLITSLLKPASGQILISGEDAKSKISYMTQEDLLLEYKTVLANLMMVFQILHPFKLFQMKAYLKQRRLFMKKALMLLDEMGLCGYHKHYPRQLSKGMRQRVALIRALLFERPYLLLDEPFSAIDPMKRESLFKLLLKIKAKYNLTILQITHDLKDAKALSDKIYTLSNCSLIREPL